MHHTLLAAIAALALLALPRFAAAGPIEWTYDTTVDSFRGRISLGTTTLDRYNPSTGETEPATYFLFGSPPGALPTSPQAGGVTNLRVAVLSNSSGVDFYDTPPPAADSGDFLGSQFGDFRVSLAITDGESGATGTVAFDGRGSASTGTQIGDPYLLSLSVEGGTKTLILGGNKYEVSMHRGASETAEWVEADVRVAATPEPGTLTLAAFGLGVAGIRIRRLVR